MRDRGRGGDGGRDWGNIDWSNIDLSGFGRGTRVPGPSRRAVLITAVLVILILIPLFIGPIVGFLTDLLWFRSLGLEAVYLRRFTASFYAFGVFGLVFFVLALPNLYFALRPQVPRVVVDAERRRRGALRSTLRYMWLLLIPAFFFGLAGGDEWDMLLRYVNQVPFGTADPVFGRDIGFYFFTLPVLEFVRGWLLVALIVIAIGVVTLYFTRGVIGVATGSLASADIRVAGRTALALARPARAHLSILGGLFLALIASGYLLDQFELLFRQETVLVGARDACRVFPRHGRRERVQRRRYADGGGGPRRAFGYEHRAPLGLPAAAAGLRSAAGAPPAVHVRRRRHRPLPDRKQRAAGDAGRPGALLEPPAAADVGEPAPRLHARPRRRRESGGWRRRGRSATFPRERHPAGGRAEDR